MKFRSVYAGNAVQIILFVCSPVLSAISAMLAYGRDLIPAGMAFASAMICLGCALLLQRRERRGAGPERSVWKQRDDELDKLLGLLQSVAITLCSE
jgi:hypothetical protein